MGEDSNKPMNVYISEGGQTVLLGKVSSIEISNEEIYPTNLSYLNPAPSLTFDVELAQFNLDFFLTIGTPLMREEDYQFKFGPIIDDDVFRWRCGDADDLIELLSSLLSWYIHGNRDGFLFYWVFDNLYQLKLELLDGSDYHAHDCLESITLDGHTVTPTALMLFRVVNFLCMYKADTELVLDGARVRLTVERFDCDEEES